MVDQKTIIVETYERQETVHIVIPWIAIAGVLVAVLILLFSTVNAQSSPDWVPESPADAIRRSLREEQSVFPFSSSRAITEEEIGAMYEVSERPHRQLIQQAINELYARNKYQFEDSQWADYYKAYGGNLSMEAARNQFSDIEELNLDRLVQEREKWN